MDVIVLEWPHTKGLVFYAPNTSISR
jgi:hypothetical protein